MCFKPMHENCETGIINGNNLLKPLTMKPLHITFFSNFKVGLHVIIQQQ